MALFFFRQRVTYSLRAGILISLFLIIGLAGFWKFGFVAGANPVLLVTPVLATVLFGRRLGMALTTVMLILMIAIGYSFVFGGRDMSVNFDASAPFLPSWIVYILTVLLTAATAIAAISMSNHHLAAALAHSRLSQDDLTTLNRDLEHQITDRTQELEDAKQAAEKQARTDVLTGLNNRRAFFEYAGVIDSQARRYHHPYVIAMIDIDHFKQVNDTWGHEAGNHVLKAVARVISDTVRDTDIVGRIGGEEFAVILPETDIEKATLLAERLRWAIEKSEVMTSDVAIRVTASFGIAASDEKIATLDALLAYADAALYQAKKAGRNRIDRHREDFGGLVPEPV